MTKPSKTEQAKIAAERQLAREQAEEDAASRSLGRAAPQSRRPCRGEAEREEEMSTDIKDMSYEEASTVLRMLERAGSRQQDKMLALAERAAETAPPEWRHVYDRRAEIYRAGRTIRVKTVEAALTSIDGVPVELIDEINSVEEEFGKEES